MNDPHILSEVGKVLQEVAIATVVSKAEPLFDSGLKLLFLWVKSCWLSFVARHWIVDPTLDDDFYFALNSDEELLRTQGKSELTLKAFRFKAVFIYRWGKGYESIKYNLTTKKIKEPKP
jgi:hypothetical protein